MKYIENLIDSGKTVFKGKELALILNIENKHTLKNILQRLKKSGIIIYHGNNLRSLKKYDNYELASKLRKRSYISFETVLQKEGVIFQDYSHTVTLASNNSINKKIDNISYEYHKLNNNILNNPIGIINYKNKYMIASKERAVCDMIYLYKNIYFDNINGLQIEKLEEIKDIYNKTTSLSIKKLIKNVESANS